MKIFANIIAASILSLPLFAANPDDAKKNIYDSNIHTADNARMDLQQLNAEKELLEALEKVSGKRLRDGVIYSLGKLKSRGAYEKILAVAQKELDKCPAAILALAEYGARKSSSDLRDLAGKGSKTAETALWMLKGAKKDLKAYSKAFFAKFDKLDDNEKAVVFGLAKQTSDFSDFAMSYRAQNQRIALAQCHGLARIDSKDDSCARKISEISEAYPDAFADFAAALASAKNSEGVISSLAGDGKKLGVAAAKIRCCAEAEADVLKAYAEAKDAKFKRLCAEALQSIGMGKTAESLISDFNSIKKEDLADAVKILTSVASRIDAAEKEKLFSKLSESSKSADDIHKSAAEKILK